MSARAVATHRAPSRQDRQPAPLQRLRYPHPHLAPGRLFDRHRHDCRLDFRCGAVLRDRLPAADLLQGQLAPFVVQLLEAVEVVAALSSTLAICGGVEWRSDLAVMAGVSPPR